MDVVPIGLERLVALGLLSFYVADFTYTMRYQLKAAEMEEEEGVSVSKKYWNAQPELK